MEKNHEKTCSKVPEMEEYGGHTPLLPAQMLNDGNWLSPKMPTTSKPGHLEYPRTPVPWSKCKFSHKPAGLTTSTKQSERLGALAVTVVGSGGHQVEQAEDIVKVKKAKTLHPRHLDKVGAVDVVENFIGHFLTYLNECPDRPDFKDTRELIPGDNYAYEQMCELLFPEFFTMAILAGESWKLKSTNLEVILFGKHRNRAGAIHTEDQIKQDGRHAMVTKATPLVRCMDAGEFEVLLTIPLPDCTQYMEVEGYKGLSYTLSLLKKSHGFPATFLLEDERTISPRNITEEFWKQVNAFINVVYSGPFPGWQMRLEKKKPNRPMVSLVVLDDCGSMFMAMNLVLLLEFTGQWPGAKEARELMEDHLMAHLMERFYFVAEQRLGRHNKETWRISFCHVEKEILYRHSSPQACYRHHGSKCCRNYCLTMLQDLVDSLKMEHPLMLAPLSSYHIQTSFLHTLWKWKADTDWKPSAAAYCFERVLGNFIQEVASAHLSHFFLPTCNLFAAKFFPPTKLKFLCSHLREKEAAAKTSHQKSYPAPAVRSDMKRPHWAVFSCSP